jgi:hypothetical protein
MPKFIITCTVALILTFTASASADQSPLKKKVSAPVATTGSKITCTHIWVTYEYVRISSKDRPEKGIRLKIDHITNFVPRAESCVFSSGSKVISRSKQVEPGSYGDSYKGKVHRVTVTRLDLANCPPPLKYEPEAPNTCRSSSP